jgi:hypothetical protein
MGEDSSTRLTLLNTSHKLYLIPAAVNGTTDVFFLVYDKDPVRRPYREPGCGGLFAAVIP